MKTTEIIKSVRHFADMAKFYGTNGSGWENTCWENIYMELVVLADTIEQDDEKEIETMGRSLEVPRADLSPIKVTL